MVEIDVDMKEVLKNLEKLPEKVQKRVVKGAVRAAAKPIVKEARRLVPVRTGNLKKSIGVNARRSDKTTVRVSISPRKGGRYDGFYGHFVEFGTKNSAPHPFMRPAFEFAGGEAIKAFRAYMKKRIDKELGK